VTNGDVTARIIAGDAFGTRAIIETRIPIIYVHFTLQPGARTVLSVPKEYNTFAYVVGGQGQFGPNNNQKEVHRGSNGYI
jgi:redox-sensitive bicupin YhaK (pirin superfamily)